VADAFARISATPPPKSLVTARALRRDPAEVSRALLTDDVAGRDRSALATRLAWAAFPTGKPFAAWDEVLSSIAALTLQRS
jgi:hypothetical protein